MLVTVTIEIEIVRFRESVTNVLDKIDAAEINLMLSFKIQYGHSESEEF